MKQDPKALFCLEYGLYVLTTHDGKKDNGIVVNTVMQLTSNPERIAVTVHKDAYSHDIIRESGKLNVNCLDVDTPFSVFERFGFQSGREVDKLAGLTVKRSQNGLAVLDAWSNACLSLEVEQYIDFGTHGMFVCRITESFVLRSTKTMTYSHYHAAVKPKPAPEKKKGYVCKICGYVYEGDPLPADFVCPWCHHGATDFEPLA